MRHRVFIIVEAKIKKGKGAPWWFGGPTQLVYFAHREDRHCSAVRHNMEEKVCRYFSFIVKGYIELNSLLVYYLQSFSYRKTDQKYWPVMLH